MKNNNNNNYYNVLHITKDHTGKMLNMASLSTSVVMNEYCMQNRMLDGSICQKCYAIATTERYTPLAACLEHNYNLLTKDVLQFVSLPYTTALLFRFEAFGDIANETHFINYLNICYKNPQTYFALWTKNPQIIDTVLNEMKYKKPDNLQIIVSSLYLNVVFNIDKLPYKNRYWFINKVFTVYTMDYAIKNKIKINCGGNACYTCQVCYVPNIDNKIVYINEMLKSDWRKYKYTINVLNAYKEWLGENERTHSQESTDFFIVSLYYELRNDYTGEHSKINKWIKNQEKRMETAINTYAEYYL